MQPSSSGKLGQEKHGRRGNFRIQSLKCLPFFFFEEKLYELSLIFLGNLSLSLCELLWALPEKRLPAAEPSSLPDALGFLVREEGRGKKMSARPQVTITLGRKGQVVKRARTTSDVSSSDYDMSSEGKRSIRERLGNDLDGQHSYGYQYIKRQRTDSYNLSNIHMADGRQHMSNRQVSRDDLRHKLMSKGLSRSKADYGGQNGVDLREKLSRSSRIPLRYESRQNMLESRSSTLSRRIPPARSADDLLQLGSSRKSFPSLTLDGLRHRSPDRLLGASRPMSPPRRYDVMRNIPYVRPYDDSGPTGLVTRSIPDTSRTATFMSKAAPVDAAKPILRASGVVQKSPYIPDEPHTVAGLLHSLGLGKYAIHFQAEEVDMAALMQMGDTDLKELGIPMGPRKKILLALLPRSKRQH